ncbi:MAG TPA: glycerol-3-phosphate dehydrogenase [Pyrinomonadaceae bacterium]|nr:glycerol-3-phosphate dehydrogenase [Pyrinomonadaceae bacterium]
MINAKPTISETSFDVIVIGAGINGAGIARDAAMRGLKVLLLDKGDMGGGTSAWSTRLIHGGLRYLEHGEFGLVRESLRERERLIRIAPHLVRPMPLLIPIYEEARRGPWTMRAGMVAYDLLSFDKTLPRHRMLSRAEALQQIDGLNPNGLVGAAVYYDGQVEFAERLVVENALSAVKHGAEVVTYARVDHFEIDHDQVRAVEFVRERTGERETARASIVINAGGPWVDQILYQLQNGNAPDTARLIGGTKGSHIIVGPFPGAPTTAIYVEAQTDHRPFFIIPWNSKYLIGTTDIRYDGNLDDVIISSDEIEYLLRETNRVILSASLDRDQILYSYSGVRPLPFAEDKDEQSITRRHFIRQHPKVENLFSIVGGKLTTYRSLAEEAADLIFDRLGRNSPKCNTDTLPLTGDAESDFETFRVRFNNDRRLSSLSAEHLLRTYGVAAESVVKLVDEDSRLVEVIDPETGAIAAEVVYAFRSELAQTLTDCLMRRTMIGLNSTQGLDAVKAAARVAQNFLHWSNEEAVGETESYREYVNRRRLQ